MRCFRPRGVRTRSTAGMWRARGLATSARAARNVDAPAACEVHLLPGGGASCKMAVTVSPLFTPSECAEAIQFAEDHAAAHGGWTTTRHHAVPTTDVPLHEIPTLLRWFNDALASRLSPMLSAVFRVSRQRIRVHDAFLVRYDAGRQAHLPLHTDESMLSLTVVLNDGFVGGGTFFADLRRAVSPLSAMSSPLTVALCTAASLLSEARATSWRRSCHVEDDDPRNRTRRLLSAARLQPSRASLRRPMPRAAARERAPPPPQPPSSRNRMSRLPMALPGRKLATQATATALKLVTTVLADSHSILAEREIERGGPTIPDASGRGVLRSKGNQGTEDWAGEPGCLHAWAFLACLRLSSTHDRELLVHVCLCYVKGISRLIRTAIQILHIVLQLLPPPISAPPLRSIAPHLKRSTDQSLDTVLSDHDASD